MFFVVATLSAILDMPVELTDKMTIEGLCAKRAYIRFWLIFIFCRIKLISGRLTCSAKTFVSLSFISRIFVLRSPEIMLQKNSVLCEAASY